MMGLPFKRLKMFSTSSGHLYLICAHGGRSLGSTRVSGRVMQTILRSERVCVYSLRIKSSSIQRCSYSCGVNVLLEISLYTFNMALHKAGAAKIWID